ncbi:MAG TPA: protein kinase, partial [Planctomycetota bacterium]|nr:protein kinase [Planctomycetota bacterium]
MKEPTGDDEARAPALPQQIGPYRVLERIGEGGMGIVYVADQLEPVRRRVALKVIRADRDGKRYQARFEMERKALERMDHPNVARIFDAGVTADGKPYFAMELVRGVGLTEYCDTRKLTLSDRLRLFRQVCDGVQHA